MGVENKEFLADRAKIMDNYNTIIEEAKWQLFSLIWYEQTWDLFFNKAYFVNWEVINQDRINDIISEANDRNRKLEEINITLEKETSLNPSQKKIIKDRIIRLLISNEYHKKAIYIEAEKAWFKLSNKDRIRYRKKALKIENDLYWTTISERPERKQKVIDKLHQLYEENNKELTDEEKAFWTKNIINKYVKSNSLPKEIWEKKEDFFIKDSCIFDLIVLLLEIEWFDRNKITKIQLSNDISWIEEQENWVYLVSTKLDATEIDKYFEKLWIENNLRIIKRVKWNNSVDIRKEKEENWEIKFKKNCINLWATTNNRYPINRVLSIIFEHEIGTHAMSSMGNIRNTNIKDPERWDLEEWIALLNQKMTKGEWLWDFYDASIWDIRTFLAEQLDEYELKKYLSIYYKLTKAKDPNIDDTIRRAKMGIPIGEKGARRRDITYGNSKEIIRKLEDLSKTAEWRKTLNKYAKVIYSTGIWYEALENIDDILEWIKGLNELEPNFPIFAGKILYWKLFKGKLDKDKMLESDLRNAIENKKDISFKQKKLLVEILKVIKSNSLS